MDEGRMDIPQIRVSGKEARVRIPSRATIHAVENPGPTQDAGLPFWDKLTPEIQTVIEGPIRRTEEMIARQFPDGFVSPKVAKARTIRDQDGLEEQHDTTSCTYVATANALRLLDTSRPEYSRDALKVVAGGKETIPTPDSVRGILNSGEPYNQFYLEVPHAKVRLASKSPDVSPDMDVLFNDLARGGVAVAAWRLTPTKNVSPAGMGAIEHARTIAGFSRGPDNTLQLHIIDPYGARQEVWSFRDWIVAMRMNYPFDNPEYTPEEVKNWMENLNSNTGLMRNIAEDVNVIHKKKPQIVVSPRH